MNHSQLVALASRWLQRKCAVAITELVTSGETPDVIGWHGRYSTLIECKTSRADFLADAKKWFRREEQSGIGSYRYFLTLSGLIAESELPPKWGLLEVTGNKIRIVRKSEYFEHRNHGQEIGILISTLRRIGANPPIGVSIKCYVIASKNTATVSIEPPCLT